MSNLRLLCHKTFEVKDLPLDKDNYCENYSLLMPIECCGKVAEFKFNASFTKAVSPEFMSKPLEEGTGYMLTSRIIFSKEFAYNHEKSLDKTNIFCTIKNVGYDSNPEYKTKIYFNKEILPLDQIFIRLGDKILFAFFVEDPYSQSTEEREPFATYFIEVKSNGF